MKQYEDFFSARLISCSEPFVDEDSNQLNLSNVQEFIAYCARVSNPSNQNNHETADKLLAYLIKNKHWSPFEMANACIEINTTRDIAHQILRHRSFSFQEFSQRYADPTAMLDGFVLREARLQDTKNRQNSILLNSDDIDDQILKVQWEALQMDVITVSKAAYKWAIGKGIAKEQARVVLPEGLTCTRMYMNGTLRSWIHFLENRMGIATQKEHRQVALACADAISKVFPIVKELVIPVH